MQPNKEAKIEYGMLVFAIFGHRYLDQQSDEFKQALGEYRQLHPRSQSPPSRLRLRDKFYTWHERRLLAQYALPEPFIQSINEALDALPPRHKEVLRMRFGLIDGVERTAIETADKIYNMETGRKGVTRERVLQIETKALRRLRHPSRSRTIKASLTDSYLRNLFGFESPEEA